MGAAPDVSFSRRRARSSRPRTFQAITNISREGMTSARLFDRGLGAFHVICGKRTTNTDAADGIARGRENRQPSCNPDRSGGKCQRTGRVAVSRPGILGEYLGGLAKARCRTRLGKADILGAGHGIVAASKGDKVAASVGDGDLHLPSGARKVAGCPVPPA